LCSITASIGSHRGSFGKGRSQLWKPRDELATQRLMIDFTLDWVRAQNFVGRAPLCRQSQQLFTDVAVKRQPTLGDSDAFLAGSSDLRGHVVVRSGELSLKRVNLGVKLFCRSASPLANYCGHLGNLLPTRIGRYRSLIKGLFSATAPASTALLYGSGLTVCHRPIDPIASIERQRAHRSATRQCIRHVS
jgi:hypothetical protein